MTIAKRLATTLLVILAMSSAPFAAKLSQPRELEPLPEPRRFLVERGDVRIAALGIGNVRKFAALDSWVTSDWMFDDYTTFPSWCSAEILKVLGHFYSQSAKSTQARLQIRNQVGTIVYDDSFVDEAFPEDVNQAPFLVGQLPAGGYKVTIKFKQGSTIVGQTYWIAVDACSLQP